MYDIKSDFKRGLLPNSVTAFGLLMIPPIILFHREGGTLWALLYFVMAWFCDWLDGFLARKYKMTSLIGEFFDPLADKGFTWSMLIYFWDRVPSFVGFSIIGIGLLATVGRCIIIASGRKYHDSIDVMAGWAGKLKVNFEKSGLIAIILADIFLLYTNQPLIYDIFMFISKLGLWLSLPLAAVSFYQIMTKLQRLYREPT